MIACLVDNEIVINTIVVESLSDAPLGYIECPSWIGMGMNINTPEPPSPSANENKTTGKNLLLQTDWTTIADVGDPAKSQPYLQNQAEFISWRNEVRNVVLNPVCGPIECLKGIPEEIWVYS
jgi:hypothetical protein